MKAEPGDQRQRDAHRERAAQFDRDAEDREIEPGAVLASREAVIVGNVADNRAQHEIARTLAQPLQRGEQQHQPEAVGAEEQEAEVDRGLDEFGEHRALRLAERLAHALPDRRCKDTERILEQEHRRRPLGPAQREGDHEQQQPGAHALPRGDGGIGSEHAQQQRIAQHRFQRGTRRGAVFERGRRAVGHGGQRQPQAGKRGG